MLRVFAPASYMYRPPLGSTVILNSWVAFGETPLVTPNFRSKMPCSVPGMVPDSTPVFASSVMPSGNSPVIRL